MPHGGFNAGHGGGFHGGNPNGAAGRQIYVANVCFNTYYTQQRWQTNHAIASLQRRLARLERSFPPSW